MGVILEVRRVRRVFRQPVRLGDAPSVERTGLLVRVSDTASGRVGFGEVAPLPAFGTESVDEADEVLHWLARHGAGDFPALLECCSDALDGFPCARTAVETAVAFAVGEAFLAPARVRLPVAALAGSVDYARAHWPDLRGAGFRTLKIKIGGGDVRGECAQVMDIASRLKEDERIRLDANGTLTTEQAQTWLTALDACDAVEFLEQPLPDDPDALAQMIAMTRQARTPLALDESVTTFERLRELAGAWPGLLVVKPALLGNLRGFIQWVRESGVRDRLVFSSAFETAVGCEMALRLAATAGCRASLGFGTNAFFQDGDPFRLHPDEPFLISGAVGSEDFQNLWEQCEQ